MLRRCPWWWWHRRTVDADAELTSETEGGAGVCPAFGSGVWDGASPARQPAGVPCPPGHAVQDTSHSRSCRRVPLKIVMRLS